MVALAAAAVGGLGDLGALALKEWVFEPLYQATGRQYIPVLGRGPRPAGAKDCGILPRTCARESYGLPSGHAAHMWAMAAFVIDLTRASPAPPTMLRLLITVSLCSIAMIVSWSRVHLGCHTWSQVMWGGGLGCLIGGWTAGALEDTIWKTECGRR